MDKWESLVTTVKLLSISYLHDLLIWEILPTLKATIWEQLHKIYRFNQRFFLLIDLNRFKSLTRTALTYQLDSNACAQNVRPDSDSQIRQTEMFTWLFLCSIYRIIKRTHVSFGLASIGLMYSDWGVYVNVLCVILFELNRRIIKLLAIYTFLLTLGLM